MKMNKCFLRKVLVTCAATTGLLGCCFAYSSTPFYVGAMLGGFFARLDKTVTVTNPVPISPLPTTYRRESAMNGFAGGGYLGVAFKLHSARRPWVNNISLAIEADALGTTAKSVTTITNIPGIPPQNMSLKETMPFTLAIGVLPGYFLTTNTKLYARVALVFSKFKSSSVDGYFEGYTGAFSEMITGGQFGAGLETFFSERWSGRIEYDYMHYERVSKTAISLIVGNQVMTQYCPDAHQVLFSISYHFSTP